MTDADPISGAAYAREDDPETAHDAAAFVEGDVATRQEKLVLWMLEGAWPDGLTTFELAVRAGVLRDSISPRFRPLADKKLIHDSGERRAKPGGGLRSIVCKHGPRPETAPAPTTNIAAVYHIAAINHWREIVNEQLSLLSKAEFKGPIHCSFTGLEEEWGYVEHIARRYALRVELWCRTRLDEFEFPAMRMIEDIAPDHDAVLYFHTKGVSHNNSWPMLMWRMYMNAWCLTGWRAMFDSLMASECDCSGAGWTHWWGASGWPGNFWMAKSPYLRSLTPFDEYLTAFGGTRFAAEFWINSRSEARPLNFGLEDTRFWDHSFWTAHPQRCTFAYIHGTP